MNKILVPLDGSEISEKAVEVAFSLAAPLHAELILMRAVPDLMLTPGAWSTYQVAEILEHEAEAAEKYLQEVAKRWSDKGVQLRMEVRRHDAPDAILELARDLAPTMIVLTTHGRSGLSRMLLGSVAERVVRQAPCPVLTLTPEALETRVQELSGAVATEA